MAFEGRSARAGEAICGVAPQRVYEPESLAEAASMMADCRERRAAVAFVGGGTQLALGFPPRAVDTAIRTSRLSRVLEHVPSDLVISVEAGVTLAELQRVVGEHGQRLALDAPQPDLATLGGLVATAAFGPRRARYGALRDLVLGVTLVRGDGALAKSGGKVVKNVAGFDLPKVVCGSLGSLGLLAALTFRLHPLPEASQSLVFPHVSGAQVWQVLRALREAQLEPSASVVLRAAGGLELGVLFEGFGRAVEQQVERAERCGSELGLEVATLDAGAALQFWAQHESARTGGPLRVRLAALPAKVAALEQILAPLFGVLASPRLAWYASLGIGFASGEPASAEALQRAVNLVRAGLRRDGGSLVIETAPSPSAEQLDPWGDAGSSFAIMRELKQRFDPDGRLNPGRFIGRL